LKDTPVVEKPRFESIFLTEPIDTIGEQHVDDGCKNRIGSSK
jgi:hypothetical protein